MCEEALNVHDHQDNSLYQEMGFLYVLNHWRQVTKEFAGREEREIKDIEIEKIILVVQ